MKKAYRKPEMLAEVMFPQRVNAGSCQVDVLVNEDGTMPIIPGLIVIFNSDNVNCNVQPDKEAAQDGTMYCVQLAGSADGVQLFSLN
ncbi:MAG: hypothetical protein IKI64_00420 [Clostridia bacterium]|nr:hypothetical protein [Clostridia bacterium]